MEYKAYTEDITVLVSTTYDPTRSNSESTYYRYSVVFINNSVYDWEIIGRELTVRPNTVSSETRDITITSLSKAVKGAIIPYDDTYVYDTFSVNNGPVTIRGYYYLKSLQTDEILKVKFPLTFFPKITI